MLDAYCGILVLWRNMQHTYINTILSQFSIELFRNTITLNQAKKLTLKDYILEKAAQLTLHILYHTQENMLAKMLNLSLLRIVATRMAECSSPTSPLRNESLTEIFIRICETLTSFNAVVSQTSFHPH